MQYSKMIILKNGKEAWLKNGEASDGSAVYENFNAIHAETDYLLTYPDENSFDPEREAQFLQEKIAHEQISGVDLYVVETINKFRFVKP